MSAIVNLGFGTTPTICFLGMTWAIYPMLIITLIQYSLLPAQIKISFFFQILQKHILILKLKIYQVKKKKKEFI